MCVYMSVCVCVCVVAETQTHGARSGCSEGREGSPDQANMPTGNLPTSRSVTVMAWLFSLTALRSIAIGQHWRIVGFRHMSANRTYEHSTFIVALKYI